MTIQQAFELALAHHRSGRLSEAEPIYWQILKKEPRHADALHMLGVLAHEMGRNDVAIELIRRAVDVAPGVADFHSDLGAVYRATGQPDEAIAACRGAIALAPRLSGAHYNLGNAFREKGELDAAIDAFREAIGIKPDYAEAHCNLGHALRVLGRLEEAVASFQRAVELGPALLSAKAGLCAAMNDMVPLWHVPMMNDRKRNDFYFAALKAAVTPDSSVLEIGTGSGLLSMMAARLGAREVTTCESVPLIAATARRIISDNGLDERIRVISRKSTDVAVGADLAQMADILVSEIFSNELLAEGVLPSIEDAKRRLLKPDARIIPAAGSIMIALFGGDDLASNLIVEDSCGFNLRHFNSIVSRRQTVAGSRWAIELLTDDVEAFRFDFGKDSFFPCAEKALRIPVRTPGRCVGIIQWIRLEMGTDLVFENHPSGKAGASSWHYCVSILPSPVELRENEVAIVSAAHDRRDPWFSLHAVEAEAGEQV
jgi:tetratricopeptide (TPR) repeat protein